MGAIRPLKFAKGDIVVYKGSVSSYYGFNGRADKFIGDVVTIVDTYNGVNNPHAYLFGEFEERFWFDEDCFEYPVQELPEFDVNQSLEALLL